MLCVTSRVAALPFITLLATSLWAQEDAISSARLQQADAIVVGTLVADYRFPWFDGWNERGHIVVKRVLFGSVKIGSPLPFSWERDFRQGWCLTRPDWRGAVGKRGIWVLSRYGSRYRAPDLFSGFREVSDLDAVLKALSETDR
jgi:hypothetical protein